MDRKVILCQDTELAIDILKIIFVLFLKSRLPSSLELGGIELNDLQKNMLLWNKSF